MRRLASGTIIKARLGGQGLTRGFRLGGHPLSKTRIDDLLEWSPGHSRPVLKHHGEIIVEVEGRAHDSSVACGHQRIDCRTSAQPSPPQQPAHPSRRRMTIGLRLMCPGFPHPHAPRPGPLRQQVVENVGHVGETPVHVRVANEWQHPPGVRFGSCTEPVPSSA